MESLAYMLLLLVLGSFLLWFGYTLFLKLGGSDGVRTEARQGSSIRTSTIKEGFPGAPKTCPVCSARLEHGEKVHSSAFPSMGESTDRLMHITGCIYCLNGERARSCPVCAASPLKPNEVLIARLFDKPGRSHVHVLGCSRCRGRKSRN